MNLILRKTRAHCRTMGWTDSRPREDNYGILDGEAVVGRIYFDTIHGGPKWRWFLQTVPATPPQGMADSLDAAKAAFKERYEQVAQK